MRGAVNLGIDSTKMMMMTAMMNKEHAINNEQRETVSKRAALPLSSTVT